MNKKRSVFLVAVAALALALPFASAAILTCTDSDGGDELAEEGSIELVRDDGTAVVREDYCVPLSKGGRRIEFFCSTNASGSIVDGQSHYYCGDCTDTSLCYSTSSMEIAEEIAYADSDAGRNYLSQGSIQLTVQATLLDGTVLAEDKFDIVKDTCIAAGSKKGEMLEYELVQEEQGEYAPFKYSSVNCEVEYGSGFTCQSGKCKKAKKFSVLTGFFTKAFESEESC